MIEQATADEVIRCIGQAELSNAISEFEALTCLGIVHLGLHSSYATDYFEMARLVAQTDEEKTLITEVEGLQGSDTGEILQALDKYLELFSANSARHYN